MPTPKKTTKTDEKPAAETVEQLNEKLANFAADAQAIENKAAAEKRDLTPDEVKELKAISVSFDEVEGQIAAHNVSAAMRDRVNAPLERITQPDPVEPGDEEAPKRPAGTLRGGAPSGATKGNWGFTRGFGEFAIAAMKTQKGQLDQRIVNAPSTYGAEGSNADGGFAVPPDFRQEIMKQVMGEESLLSRCDQQQTQGNSLTLPLDSTTPWQTSGGVLASWAGEGQALTASKPSLGQLETKLNKLTALVPLTDELLEDVPAMNRWLTSKVPEKFTSVLNNAIVAGSGAGQPQGILNAACKVTQTAESGQGASTIVAKNILKMWSRRYARNQNAYAWLINQDCEQQLQQMVMPGTNPSFPAYMPPGGFSQSPYATLLGRPIVPVEACKALGTEGDIILADLTQYLVVLKAGGIRSDVSIHLYFDSDHVAFRFIMRAGGQPYWPAAISRQNGSNTLSPFVTLNSTRT